MDQVFRLERRWETQRLLGRWPAGVSGALAWMSRNSCHLPALPPQEHHGQGVRCGGCA